jgi:hypothetical protein
LFPSGFPSSERFNSEYLVIAPDMTTTTGNGIVGFGRFRDLTSSKLLKNYIQIEIQGLMENQGFQSPPLKKGDLGGFQTLRKSPLTPLFQRGGKRTASNKAQGQFLNSLLGRRDRDFRNRLKVKEINPKLSRTFPVLGNPDIYMCY